MSESVLRPIILRNKKQRNQRNEATTNYERSVVLHPMGAYPEGAVLCTQNQNVGTDFLLEMSSLAFRSVRSFFTVSEPPESWLKQYRNDTESTEYHVNCRLCRSSYC